MITTPTSVIKRLPYVGPVVSSVGLALDVKEIVENATPVRCSKDYCRSCCTCLVLEVLLINLNHRLDFGVVLDSSKRTSNNHENHFEHEIVPSLDLNIG